MTVALDERGKKKKEEEAEVAGVAGEAFCHDDHQSLSVIKVDKDVIGCRPR